MHILLIFSNFVVEIKSKSQENHMYNFCAKFRQILDICKCHSENLVNSRGNVPRVGVVPRFSDLEVIALSLTAEALGIDSELHGLTGTSGVFHSYDITAANVHDINYLNDVKLEYHGCGIVGDKGYLSAEVQLDLFETANIRLETPSRSNQKEARPFPVVLRKVRKRIETNFSQLCDQFLFIRNYAKNVDGLFTRIIGKISAFTVLQYINKINNKPIGQIKYALL